MLNNEKSALGGKIKKVIILGAAVLFFCVVMAPATNAACCVVSASNCLDTTGTICSTGSFYSSACNTISTCTEDVATSSTPACCTTDSSCGTGFREDTSVSCGSSNKICCVAASAGPLPGNATGINPIPGNTTGVNPIPGNVTGTNPIPIPDTGLPDPPGGIKTVLENLLRWMLGIVGVVAIIGFVVSGIQYIVSTGNETVMESAKRNMLFSIIGIIVVLSSFVIIQAINYALEARSLF